MPNKRCGVICLEDNSKIPINAFNSARVRTEKTAIILQN